MLLIGERCMMNPAKWGTEGPNYDIIGTTPSKPAL
jgi:hypothetical protein